MKCALAILLALTAFAGCGARRPPLSPRDELKTFRLPPGFRAELVAAEPDVIDPVALDFDERGRMFVVEMSDYPLDPEPRGRIRLLEDRDGDGRYERSAVFADKLHMPDGVMRWRSGILVACAPDILYLEDTDGDGRADVRRVVLTGFAATNPQLRINGLQYGLDNWIYASYPRVPTPRRYVKEFGDPGKTIRFPGHPGIPDVEIRSVDLRFHPEKLKLEAVAGNSQFGNAFDAWGNRFTVWNNDHIRHVVIQSQYLGRNPYLAVPLAMQSLSDHENAATVYPVTRDPHHIHDSQIGHFTSACGLSVYTGGNFPTEFDGNSFTCEPVHNLVHRDILAPKGATFVARRAYEGKEFLASTDSWFRPVFTTVGPDGAIYIADYYRFTVEHPEFVPPELLKQIDFQPHHKLGRIWRIVHESSKPGSKPNLDRDLAPYLAHPNRWWRITAQRLIVDRGDRSATPALEAMAKSDASPLGRVHALWTLDGLDALNPELLVRALSDPHAGVRENAVRIAEKRLPEPRLQKDLVKLIDDPEPRVRFQAACTLGKSAGQPVLERLAARHIDDPWFQVAILTSAADDPAAWFRAFLGKPEQSFTRRIASIIGARKRDREIAGALSALKTAPQDSAAAALQGLADGLRLLATTRVKLSASQPILLRLLRSNLAKPALRLAGSIDLTESAELRALIREAAVAAQSSKGDREQAIGVLGLDPSGRTASLLQKFLDPHEPDQIQIAAAGALSRLRSEMVAKTFVDRWRAATGRVRETMVAGFFADRSRIPTLLEAVESGAIQPWALGPGRTRQLLQHSDPQVRAKAQSLLGESSAGERKSVYERYLPAIRRDGDPERGRQVFEKNCSECHKVANIGFEVGPDLRSVTTRYKESLLADILIPNQAIETGYEEYLVETTDGRSISGVLARETPTTLTLRRRKGEEDTILRSSVASLRSLTVSPMPDDLEKGITVDQMADLIAYIKSLK